MRRFQAKAFTLLETMIVVALIAILTSLAYAGYRSAVQKSNRGDAQTALTGLASAMQRLYTEQTPSTYAGGAAGGGDTGSPAIFPTQSPLDGAQKHYNLVINSANATSYELRAVPIAGSVQANDKCGTLTLTSTGQRGITDAQDGVAWQDCWR
jgi:type IV pilus assembly protein PilE